MVRPAFVVTVAALAQLSACDGASTNPTTGATSIVERVGNPPPAQPPPAQPPSAQSSQAPPPSASAHHNPPPVLSSDPTKKKRDVRDVVPKAQPFGKRASPGVSINPRASDGRTIYARGDGHCYVKVPPNVDAAKPASKHPPQPVAIVDCPAEMLDAAWDTCLGGRMRKLKEGCLCRIDGNPPPPPSRAECPKS